MVMAKIMEGINASPLDEQVKIEIYQMLELHLDEIKVMDHLLKDEMINMPPERRDNAWPITNQVITIIGSLFSKYSVPYPNRRDTDRHIYDALDGKLSMNYEVQE